MENSSINIFDDSIVNFRLSRAINKWHRVQIILQKMFFLEIDFLNIGKTIKYFRYFFTKVLLFNLVLSFMH